MISPPSPAEFLSSPLPLAMNGDKIKSQGNEGKRPILNRTKEQESEEKSLQNKGAINITIMVKYYKYNRGEKNIFNIVLRLTVGSHRLLSNIFLRILIYSYKYVISCN